MSNLNGAIARPAFKRLLAAVIALACALALAGCSGSGGDASTSSAGEAQSASSAAETSASESASASASESASASTEGKSESTAADAEEEDPSLALQSAINEARSNGLEVFEGTLRVLTADELLKLQEADPNIPGMDGTFAVLVFDQETEVVGQSGDGSGERTDTATMIGVAEYTEYESFTVDEGNLDSWRAYDGQRIAVAAYPDEIWFPSDVSLPIAEPRTSKASVL